LLGKPRAPGTIAGAANPLARFEELRETFANQEKKGHVMWKASTSVHAVVTMPMLDPVIYEHVATPFELVYSDHTCNHGVTSCLTDLIESMTVNNV
jgi:hypothetical protein